MATLVLSIASGHATITSFRPQSGPIGATVGIKGTNFSTPLSVIFTGNVAAVHSFNATHTNAQVPAGAATGPITIHTSYGSAVTAASFTVTSPPTITGFSPAKGVTGDTVVITITGHDVSNGAGGQRGDG